jgi:hypothetical protein
MLEPGTGIVEWRQVKSVWLGSREKLAQDGESRFACERDVICIHILALELFGGGGKLTCNNEADV